jgi:hypothetical protein
MSLRTASIDCIDRTPLDAVQQTECADSEEEIRRLISKKNGALISQSTVVLRAPLFSGHRFCQSTVFQMLVKSRLKHNHYIRLNRSQPSPWNVRTFYCRLQALVAASK